MSEFTDTLQDEARQKAKDELEARQREQRKIALPSAAPAPQMPTKQVVRDEGGTRVESAPQSGNLSHFGRRWKLYTDSNGKINGYGTTRSTYTQTDDGRFAVIPTIVDGNELSEQDAIAHYKKTGENWGVVGSEGEAKGLVQKVHLDEQSINQKAWNDFIHNNWDEVSPEITGDKGMAEEHARRIAGKNNDEPLSSKMMRAANAGFSPNNFVNATTEDWKNITEGMDAGKIQTVEDAQRFVKQRVQMKARKKAEYNRQVGNLLASALEHANMEGAKTVPETRIGDDGKPHTFTYRIGIAFPEVVDATNKRLVDFGNNTVQQVMAKQEIDATGRAVGEPKFVINFKMDGAKNTGGVSKAVPLRKDQVVATMRRAFDTLGDNSFDTWEKTVFRDYAKEREEENLRKAENTAKIAVANDAKAKAEGGVEDRKRQAENEKRKLDIELAKTLVGTVGRGVGGTGGGSRAPQGEMSTEKKLEWVDKQIDGILYEKDSQTGEMKRRDIKPGSEDEKTLNELRAFKSSLAKSIGMNVRPSASPEQAEVEMARREAKQKANQTPTATPKAKRPVDAGSGSASAAGPIEDIDAPTWLDKDEEENFQNWLAGQPEKFRNKDFLAKYDLRGLYKDVMANNADDVGERLTNGQGIENLPTRYIIGKKNRKAEEVRRSKAKHDAEMADFHRKSERKSELIRMNSELEKEAESEFKKLAHELYGEK